MKVKCVIVDDDFYCRKLLVNLIQKNLPDLAVVGSASTIIEARNLIELFDPQLLFLDIELKGESGFDLLAHFPDPAFRIIFTTSHHEYAIKAIKASCLDFILKPIDMTELEDAVKKIDIEKKDSDKLLALQMNINKDRTLKRIIINNKNEIHYVNTDDIVCLKGDGRYTIFTLENGERLMSSINLGEYEKMLTPPVFFRCHKSWIIKMSSVKSLDKENLLIMLSGKQQASLASVKKEEFQSLF